MTKCYGGHEHHWDTGYYPAYCLTCGCEGAIMRQPVAKKLTKDKKNPGHYRCCVWDACPGNKGSVALWNKHDRKIAKTKAEERLIKAALKFMAGKEQFPWTMLKTAVDPVLAERKKK